MVTPSRDSKRVSSAEYSRPVVERLLEKFAAAGFSEIDLGALTIERLRDLKSASSKGKSKSERNGWGR